MQPFLVYFAFFLTNGNRRCLFNQNFMRSGNPVLRESTLTEVSASSRPMTLSGTVFRSVFLLLLVAATAAITWSQVSENPAIAYPLAMGGAVGGLFFAIIPSFKREWSPVPAPIYAILEGLFVGAF